MASGLGEIGVAHVVDEALGLAEPVDPALVHVEPDHVVPDLDRAQRERQSDVTLADHDHAALACPRHRDLPGPLVSRSSGTAQHRPAR